MVVLKQNPPKQNLPKQKPALLHEGAVQFFGYRASVVSKELPVFYNPAMAINRDITLLVLKAVSAKHWRGCDLLAGTGVRTLRLIKELGPNTWDLLVSNDSNPRFSPLLRKNMKLNSISSSRVSISCKDASTALLDSNGFDYIDIDPFGSPYPFLDAACKRLARTGILAVTATDTSALCGSYPKACIRKYWAVARHDALMHEAGLRILIRKIQLIAGQYEKALEPIYSYSHEHHMRVFLQAVKKKSAVDDIFLRHKIWDGAGPLWTGPLWDGRVAEKVCTLATTPPTRSGREMVPHGSSPFSNSAGLDHPPFHSPYPPSTLSLCRSIAEESTVPVLGFFDVHAFGKKIKTGNLPSIEALLGSIRSMGWKASRSHFCGTGIRTDLPQAQFEQLFKTHPGRNQ